VSRNDDTERGGGLGTPLFALLFAAVEKVVASAIGGTPKDDQADEQEYAGSQDADIVDKPEARPLPCWR